MSNPLETRIRAKGIIIIGATLESDLKELYTVNMKEHIMDKVERALIDHVGVKPGDRIIVGVSGGADSVSLLRVIQDLSIKLGLSIYAAHYNHGIRGENADGDSRFVSELCAALNVPLIIEQGNVPVYAGEHGQTMEQAARELRYGFLERARKHFNASYIAVAHHMEDQAESVLMHLFRGSGLKGLTGMRFKRDRIIRPMLDCRRKDIEEYLNDGGIPYRTDETNLVPDATRNRVRLDLIPYIEKHINSEVIPAICRMSELIQSDEAYLDSLAQEALNECRSGAGYSAKRFRILPKPILSRAIRIALARAGADKDIERAHVEAVEALLYGRTGAGADLPGLRAYMSYDTLIIGNYTEHMEFEVELNMDGTTDTPHGVFSTTMHSGSENIIYDSYTACMDVDKLKGRPCIRTRRSGDRFYPIGAPGSKKLKDYFIDKKVPRQERNMPLICVGNRVLFIPGFCVSQEVKVDENTALMVKVKFDKGSGLL